MLTRLSRGVTTGNNLVISYRPIPSDPLSGPRVITTVTLTTRRTNTITVHVRNITGLRTAHTIIDIPVVKVIGHSLRSSPMHVATCVRSISTLTRTNTSVVTVSNASHPHPIPIRALLTHVRRRNLLTVASYSAPRSNLTYRGLKTRVVNAALSNCAAPRAPRRPSLTLIGALDSTKYQIVTRKHCGAPTRTTSTVHRNT